MPPAAHDSDDEPVILLAPAGPASSGLADPRLWVPCIPGPGTMCASGGQPYSNCSRASAAAETVSSTRRRRAPQQRGAAGAHRIFPRAEPDKQEAYYKGILRDAPVEVLPLADAPSGPAIGDGNDGEDEDSIMVSSAAVPHPAAPKHTPVAPSSMKGFLPLPPSAQPPPPKAALPSPPPQDAEDSRWSCLIRGCPSSTTIAPCCT